MTQPGAVAACSAPEPAASAPAAQPVVDFVCEADVRAAIKNGRKIFIAPRAIVTPAARDVPGASETIVLAQH